MQDTIKQQENPSLLWPIQRIRQGTREQVDDHIVLEEPLEIVINGQSIAVLMRMPGQEKELAAGFGISEGYVRRAEDIMLIHHCGSGHPAPGEDTKDTEPAGSRNRVEMRVLADGFSPPDGPDVLRLIRSGCGAADPKALAETLPRVLNDLPTSVPVLLGLPRAMRERQDVHQEVGGTHAAALFDATGRFVAAAEDIGRHNAVDKVIGQCLLRGQRLTDKILVTSGRASYEMVTKAIRVGIPVAASVSSPTGLAVQLAADRGVTLIGYLRGGRMNVYTHEDRVV
jgi:FdhD protein